MREEGRGHADDLISGNVLDGFVRVGWWNCFGLLDEDAKCYCIEKRQSRYCNRGPRTAFSRLALGPCQLKKCSHLKRTMTERL